MRVCPRHPSSNWQGSPRWQRTLRHRGLQKLALNSGITGGARKMTQNASKSPITAAITRLLKAAYQSLLHNGNVHDSAGEQNLRHLHIERDETCRCMITVTFTTAEHLRHDDLHNRDIGHLKRALQLRDLRSFLNAHPRAFVVEHNGHVNDFVQERIRRVQLWISAVFTDSTRGICWTCPTVTSTTFSMDCNWRISMFF